MSLNPKESGEFIVKNAKYLSIDDNGIRNLLKEVRVIQSQTDEIFLSFV